MQILQTAKKDNYLAVKQLLQQSYEQSSGIFDYLNQALMDQNSVDPDSKKPLSSVAMNAAEDTFVYSKMFDTIKAYADTNVKEFYGINLQEFLQYPHVICEFLLKDSYRRLSAKMSTESSVVKEIQNLQNKK